MLLFRLIYIYYPLRVIDHGITKAKQIPEAELRQPTDRDDNGTILPFLTTFNPNNPSVYAIIKSIINSSHCKKMKLTA